MTAVVCALMAGVAVFIAIQTAGDKEAALALGKMLGRKTLSPGSGLFDSGPLKKTIQIVSRLNKNIPPGKYRAWLVLTLSQAGSGFSCCADEFIARKEFYLLISFTVLICLRVPWFYALLISGIIFFLPDIEMKSSRTLYEKNILRELTPALGILASCVEAGLTLDASVTKYSEKCGETFLSVEFRCYLKEIRLGKNRKEALSGLAERSGLPELEVFAGAVSRSLEYGTGLAGVLRSQCASAREKKAHRIEKLAAEAPVKLLFPLIFFIFPVVFIVIFGPVFLKFLAIR